MGIYGFGITPSSQKAEKAKYEIKETGPTNKSFQIFAKGNGGDWPISEHHTKLEATKAIKRYQAADKRRAK